MKLNIASLALVAALLVGCTYRAPSAAEALATLTSPLASSGLSAPVLIADSPTTYVGSATGPDGERWELAAGARDGELHFTARSSSGKTLAGRAPIR